MKFKITAVILTLIAIILTSCAGESVRCGNGKTENGEECDDGNTISGDGCSYDCKLESVCGNSICERAEMQTCPEDCNVCGNGICNENESVATCFTDCYCGNSTCDQGEDHNICPTDCPAVCGNDVCEEGENTSNCLKDCYCTNGTCDSGETSESCPQDCNNNAVCGNDICEEGETEASCPEDCSASPVCGNNICEEGETEASCPEDCSISSECGNSTIDSGEDCDSNNLNGQTCSSLGYGSGILSCNSNCTFDTSNCDCVIVPQSGCPSGEKCTVDTATSNRCISAGTGSEMDECASDSDCAEGLTCAGLGAIGVCRRFCRGPNATYDSGDCISSAGSICKYQVEDGSGTVVPSTYLCTAPCDVVNATGCPAGYACDLYGIDRTSNGLPDLYGSECYDLNNSAYWCNGSACSPSYGCFDFTGYGGVKDCFRWCSTANDPCPGLGLACWSFLDPVIIGGVEYGYCDFAE
ncbi:MAG: DUF4215 domain-containing protein [Myxococcota bacterium]